MQRTVTLSLLGLLVIAILVACGQRTPDATPTPIPTDTPIPTPTFTATPSTPLAILVMPSDLDPTMYDLYQTTVYNLAQQAGFRFQVPVLLRWQLRLRKRNFWRSMSPM